VALQMVAQGVTPRFQVGQYDRYGRCCNNGGNMKASAINGRGNSLVSATSSKHILQTPDRIKCASGAMVVVACLRWVWLPDGQAMSKKEKNLGGIMRV